MTDRFYAFFGGNRAAMAMDVQPSERNGVSELTFALAFCNHRDSFRKDTARKILDGRLNTVNTREEPVRLTFSTVYRGNHPKRDVMRTVMDTLRNLPKEREHNQIVLTLGAIANGLNENMEVLSR